MSQTDSTKQKYKPSTKPAYNYSDRAGDPQSKGSSSSPLITPEPSQIVRTVELSEDGKHYIIREKIGDIDFRPPTRMTFEQYEKYKAQQDSKDFWKENSLKQDAEKTDTNNARKSTPLLPPINMGPKADRIFGGNYIDIKPAGNVTLDFGGNFQRLYNPQLPARVQRSGGFVFNQSIMLNLQGKIGEKLNIGINWDTKAAFDFDNKIKLSYQGLDHDIFKSIEAGNVSMPLNSALISGAQNLFGIKTKMQFGKMTVTTIAANQRGKSETINIPSNAGAVGSATGKDIEIACTQYEDNKHFFLSHVFREHYEQAFKTSPTISSNYVITRCEVYITNRNSTTKNVRNFLALSDLGEYNPYNPLASKNLIPNEKVADNNSNGLGQFLKSNSISLREDTSGKTLVNYNFRNTVDYEVVKNARLLEEGKEYKINKQLGYISLNQNLDQSDVLAVAFEYTYNGVTYKVGEFSQDLNGAGDASKSLFLKLIKSSTINSTLFLPMWDLMMKNVYNLGVTNLNKNGFNLSVVYRDDATKLNNPSILEGTNTANIPLLRLFNSDNLNTSNENLPDNNFDYIDKITVDPDYGRLIFPVLEPFGSKLRSYFDETTEQSLINKYVFQELYDTTKQSLAANTSNNKSKFYLKGRVQSGTSGDITLPGLNITPSSIKVYAGTRLLTQGSDYEISSDGSRLTLKPEILNSGSDIKVTFEKADLVQFRQKSLLGSRFDYAVGKDVNIGSTIMHMNERPQISRVNIGDEPIRNTMLGFDVNYKKESRLITKLVDKLPFISTKAPSSVSFSGEYAAILPGNASVIGKDGNSFIDDFEGTRNPFDLTKSTNKWKIASPPTRFTNNSKSDEVNYGFNRAKLAWYNIDNTFYLDGSGSSAKPDNIKPEDVDEYHYTRRIGPTELFPNKSVVQGNFSETTLDLAYFPEERGPYNYQSDLDEHGLLKNPKQNFAGITRAIAPGMDSDFDNQNVQYIDFWLMDPFIEAANNGGVRMVNPRTGNFETIENTTGGKLYFNLGNISEDVLQDGKQSFENGLPEDGVKNPSTVDYNNWGAISNQQFIVDNFSNVAGARENQDVGYDGLKSTEESSYPKYSNFINAVKSNPNLTPEAKASILNDVSADDFKHYLSTEKNNSKIIDRYKDFNGLENNSPDNSQSTGAYVQSGTNTPDNEDLNKNNTVESEESYFEYMVSLQKQDLVVGKNYIINKLVSKSTDGKPSTWYQFRIPLRDTVNAKIIGNASLKSVRFMRMYLSEFQQPVVLRFAQLQLIASQWRPQPLALYPDTGIVKEPAYDEGFSVSTVNFEENSQGTSISSPYRIPPGFQRDPNNNGFTNQYLNEQSLRMCVDNLKGGYIRYATKDFSTTLNTTGINCINFESLKMNIHAESANNPKAQFTEDLRAIVRFGTDITDNFYQVEIPLKLSDVTFPIEDEEALKQEVWKAENELNVKFADLAALKSLRNSNKPNDNNPQSAQSLITKDGKKYLIRGNPDITNVKFFMIGVYHPDTNDVKSFCIWADELRLNGFNKKAAHAATATANISFADLATMSMTGQISSVGFGGIDQKVSDRSQEEKIQYGFQSNINLHKFLLHKVGLKLPLNIMQNVVTANPKYDPANPDVLLKNSLEFKENPEAYRKMVTPKTVTKSIGLTNVQKSKIKPDAKKHFYDIENISVSAGYNTMSSTNYQIAKNESHTYTGQANYAYAFKNVSLEPFKKPKVFNKKYLKFIKDINLSPLPTNVAVRADMRRNFSEKQNRNANLDTIGVKTIFSKLWTFDRSYNVKWSVTKSLTADYNAEAKAIIDEPEGRIANEIDGKTGIEKKELVKQSLNNFGRVKDFNQSLATNYKLPFDKLPLTDWIGADVGVKFNYLWKSNASKSLSDSLGNSIQNNRGTTLAGKVDFLKLYNKSKFLKKINNPPPKKEPKKKKVFKKRADGKVDTVEVVVPEFELGKIVLKKLMTVKSVNISYTQNEGMGIPGYKPQLKYLGFDDQFNAPGLPFMFGSQNVDQFLKDAHYNTGEKESWISSDTRLTQNITQILEQKLNLTTQVEPIKDLKINLNASKSKSSTFSLLYKDTLNDNIADFVELSSSRTGNYEITTISLNSAFGNNGRDAFEQFKNNRSVIHERLNREHDNIVGNTKISDKNIYADNSQQVLIPAFISAYMGQDKNKVALSPFPNIPLPNWTINYSGLSNFKFIKKYLPSLTLNHDYKSSYKVNNYVSSPKYTDQDLSNKEGDYSYASDNVAQNPFGDTLQFTTRYMISDVQISEKFNPLIGIQAKTKKNITIAFSLNKGRNVGLSTSNYQITENRTTDYTFKVGYTKTGLRLPKFIKAKGREITLKNLTTMQMDVSIKDNITINRYLDQPEKVTLGQKQIQIRPNITYQYSTKLTIQMYYQRNGIIPHTSSSYKNINTSFGVKLTFLLADTK